MKYNMNQHVFLLQVTGDPKHFLSQRSTLGLKQITRFQDARIFDSAVEARQCLETYFGGITETRDLTPEDFTVVDLLDLPPALSFTAAYPLDLDHIPEEGREVEIRWRDGSRCGVFKGFLRQEMLQGRWLNPLHEFIRWRYLD